MKAIVTGASGGLGLEFAKLLAGDGHDLVLVARSADKLETLADQVRSQHHVNVEVIAQDLGVPDAAARIVERVPSCDILVNNAGFASNGPFDTIPPARVREELLLDVVTLTELTRSYLPGMRERGSGRILNVASTAGFLPGPFMAVYYASKAYVLSFSQALAEELRGSGVTVTALAPGATATGFADRADVAKTLLFRLPTADAVTVATAGYRGMMAGKDLVIPGFPNQVLAFVIRFTPRRLLLWISRKLTE
jgi:short-subunit dehydrogenase